MRGLPRKISRVLVFHPTQVTFGGAGGKGGGAGSAVKEGGGGGGCGGAAHYIPRERGTCACSAEW
jgi:hypothetical protein